MAEADAKAFEERHAALRAELAPKSEMGSILVEQMALLSTRMERVARRDLSIIAENVRHAEDDFDEAQVDQAEGLWNGVGENPRGHARKLRKSPEGLVLMSEVWRELRNDLMREGKPYWTAAHLVKAANLLGIRDEDARGSEFGRFSRGFWGDFSFLTDGEGGGLKEDARKEWSRARLVEMIDAEAEALEREYDTLDFEILDKDRAEAASRARFDASKEANLARRYESEARRGFYKAWDRLREVEAQAAPPGPAPVSAPPPPANDPVKKTYGTLASSCSLSPAGPGDLGLDQGGWKFEPLRPVDEALAASIRAPQEAPRQFAAVAPRPPL